MKRVGIVGCGRIGLPVIKAIQGGQAGAWSIISVLAKNERELESIQTVTDPDKFFAHEFDLIIDAAGVSFLQAHGERALAIADIWTVNAAALADRQLYEALEIAGARNEHRLRVLSGAIAGLDGVATLATANDAKIIASVEIAPGKVRKTLFEGAISEAARLFPESVNIAIATALAAADSDCITVEVIQPGPGEGRNMGLSAESRYGRVEVRMSPRVIPDQGIHTAAACIIAALRQSSKVIWVG